MCWQTPGVGLGLPATKDGKISGYQNFHNKYPYPANYDQWPAIYARELLKLSFLFYGKSQYLFCG